ncbi:hypothetical protein Ddc_15754 [Ditylenchus destructor]|nr:hypothetical protein Ddc_15754 [Ditylenchus destructor]
MEDSPSHRAMMALKFDPCASRLSVYLLFVDRYSCSPAALPTFHQLDNAWERMRALITGAAFKIASRSLAWPRTGQWISFL